MILPLLCLADVFTLAVYWKRWQAPLSSPGRWSARSLGIAGATAFVTSISELALRRSIGGVGLLLTLLLIDPQPLPPARRLRTASRGTACWSASPPARAPRSLTRPGPIVALYLLAQKLDKTAFVATSGLFFTVNNLLKVPPYLATGLIRRRDAARCRWRYAAAVPVGIAAGWWANRHVPQRHFDALVARA